MVDDWERTPFELSEASQYEVVARVMLEGGVDDPVYVRLGYAFKGTTLRSVKYSYKQRHLVVAERDIAIVEHAIGAYTLVY